MLKTIPSGAEVYLLMMLQLMGKNPKSAKSSQTVEEEKCIF